MQWIWRYLSYILIKYHYGIIHVRLLFQKRRCNKAQKCSRETCDWNLFKSRSVSVPWWGHLTSLLWLTHRWDRSALMPLRSLVPLVIFQERTVGVSVYRFLFRQLAFGRGRRPAEFICDMLFCLATEFWVKTYTIGPDDLKPSVLIQGLWIETWCLLHLCLWHS